MKVLAILIALMVFSPIYSQSTLDVYCYSDVTAPGVYYNQTQLDSTIIEYGIGLSLQPKFKVVMFDTACNQINNLLFGEGFGSNNHGGNGIDWQYFTYYYSNTVQLLSLDTLINDWIPNNSPFVIYTPMEYSGPNLVSACPSLAQTFSSYWGAEVIQTEEMIVLFGIKGYPNSFEMDTIIEIDTTTNSEYIHFQTQICPHASQVVGENEIENHEMTMKVYPNPSSSEVHVELGNNQITMLKISDTQGRIIKSIPIQSGHSEYQIENLPPGNYYISSYNEQDMMEVIRFVVI